MDVTDTKTSEMVEGVARAIYSNAHIPATGGWYEGLARAAIEAMREPTEAMREAAHAAIIHDDEGNALGFDTPRIWTAMIDEALR